MTAPAQVAWSRLTVLGLYRRLLREGATKLQYTDRDFYKRTIQKEFRAQAGTESLAEKQRQLDVGNNWSSQVFQCQQKSLSMEGGVCNALIQQLLSDERSVEPHIALGVLKELMQRTKEDSFRASMAPSSLSVLINYFQKSVELLHANGTLAMECCTECVRCFRNLCVQCAQNQDVLIGSAPLRNEILQLLTWVLQRETWDEPQRVLLRCCIQFLNNLASGHSEGQQAVWQDIVSGSVTSLLRVEDEKVTQYTFMLLRTLLLNPDCSTSFAEKLGSHEIVESVLLASSTENEHDFSLQLVQLMLQSSVIIPHLFEKLSIPSQIVLLHIASAALDCKTSVEGEERIVSEDVLQCFAEKFRSTSHCILSLAMRESSDDEHPRLVSSLLDVLCGASSSAGLLDHIQELVFVLETCLELLDMVEQVGRRSDNAFTAQRDLTHQPQQVGDEASPVYGFKRHLVQLVGNMCFRHRGNQDKVRELKGIPLILQQCNLDSKNAFINQWAILAVRNLCEDNLENQAVLAGMRNQGAADNEALAKLGFEAVLREDGQVYLKNIKKK